MLVWGALGLGWPAAQAEVNVEWAYHDDADELDDRASELVPGETFAFLANESTSISTDSAIELYVLTANQFAGDGEEKVWLRWWNGEEEHWLEAGWVKNVDLGDSSEAVGTFHGVPEEGVVRADLWKFDIPSDLTRPGDNFYVIQLKQQTEDGSVEYYLIRKPDVDVNGVNNLDQAWTATAENYFGRDWKVTITD
jgi:hypothetical protein